jgi:hypothetical protein
MEQLDGRMKNIEETLGESNEIISKRVEQLKDQVNINYARVRSPRYKEPSKKIRPLRNNTRNKKRKSSRD